VNKALAGLHMAALTGLVVAGLAGRPIVAVLCFLVFCLMPTKKEAT
jgi:hypothetical protein